jgi:AraC family transcriptional regulator
MLSTILKKKAREKAAYFPERTLPFHAMVASAGFSRETRTTYDWHGLRRGKSEFALIQYCLAGSGMLSYEGQEYRVEPGQAMLLHFPHDNRYWLPPDSSFWEFLYVCVYGSEVMRIWPEIESSAGPLVSLGRNSDPITTVGRIIDRLVYSDDITVFESSALAYQLMMDLASLFLNQNREPSSESQVSAVDAVKNYCRENLRKPIGVDDMARVSGYSRFYFSRFFSVLEHCGPKEYLQRLRVKESVRLLHSTSAPVKLVAVDCGFDDVNYFCRVFRKIMSVSPAEFRKSGMFQSFTH